MEGGGNGDVGEDYGSLKEDAESKIDIYNHPLKKEPEGVVDINNYCYYGSPKEEPESKFLNVYYYPVKEEPEGVVDINNYCDYSSPEEGPESKFIDVYYYPVKEEPEDVVDVNDYYDCAQPNEEPELTTMGEDVVSDGGRDIGYDCSRCRISLSTRELKVEHELRCKVPMKQKELESQVTKLYHCHYCRCLFLNKELKEQHWQIYCEKKPIATRKASNGPNFGCDKCKFVTKWKDCLKKHHLKHNKNNAEWLTCTQCLYKTVYKQCMTRHMETHGNIFGCCCPICGKIFRTKRCLDDHLVKLHFDESDKFSKLITSKFYTCKICNKYRTVNKANFNQHLTVTHLKGVGCEKYECLYCPYSTFFKGNLTQHSKRHVEQNDNQCAVCKKQFALKMYVDSHILSNHADNVDLLKTITSKVHRCEW